MRVVSISRIAMGIASLALAAHATAATESVIYSFPDSGTGYPLGTLFLRNGSLYGTGSGDEIQEPKEPPADGNLDNAAKDPVVETGLYGGKFVDFNEQSGQFVLAGSIENRTNEFYFSHARADWRNHSGSYRALYWRGSHENPCRNFAGGRSCVRFACIGAGCPSL
jgi:hypothetical protein